MEPTTLILLALAAFVLWKLRTVLGQRGMGRDTPPFDPLQRRDGAARDKATDTSNVVPLPGAQRPDMQQQPANDGPRWQGVAEPSSALAGGLDAIAGADAGFDAPTFIAGARGAYEMIVTAFARGDRKQLSGLLARDVFEGFSAAITEREKLNQRMETTFVSLDDAKITDAAVKDRQAQITVRFVSKIISATRDAQGNVVEGDPAKIGEVIDVWTFARDIRARDPNWHLIATESDG